MIKSSLGCLSSWLLVLLALIDRLNAQTSTKVINPAVHGGTSVGKCLLAQDDNILTSGANKVINFWDELTFGTSSSAVGSLSAPDTPIMLKFSEIGSHFYIVYAKSVTIGNFVATAAQKLTIEPSSLITSPLPFPNNIIDLTTIIFTNLILVVTDPKVYLIDVITGASKTD